MRAVYNEFGTKGSGKGFKTKRGGGFGGPVPERPFMRNAMRQNKDKYASMLGTEGRSILWAMIRGGDTAGAKKRALRRIGVEAQGDIQESITDLSSPPNSPLTIQLKGSSNPLIDKGEMRKAVTWRVKE